MTPIERAALAVLDEVKGRDNAYVGMDHPTKEEKESGLYGRHPWRFVVGDGEPIDALAIARAVLTAIREPSDAMLPNPSEPETKLYAAARLMDDSSVDTATAANAIWQAMIDAALAEVP